MWSIFRDHPREPVRPSSMSRIAVTGCGKAVGSPRRQPPVLPRTGPAQSAAMRTTGRATALVMAS